MSVMGTTHVTTLIKRVYGKKYDLEQYHDVSVEPRFYPSKMQPLLAFIREKRIRLLFYLILAIVAGGSIYYFNLLVSTEQDVLAAKGKVAALQQRRNDISINLSKAALDYSKHERSVFTAVVALRSLLAEKSVDNAEIEALIKEIDGGGAADGAKLSEKLAGTGKLSALSRMLAVAEQYPDLKLSSNFNNLMTALIEVEKDLANERIKFNDAVNIYTTNIVRFPLNAYAWIFGFKNRPYFEASADASKFNPIAY